jgi:hypothetical protein
MIDPSKSWRRFVKIHAAAERDPLLSIEELRAIGKDILENGMKVPIIVWSPGEGSNNRGVEDAVLIDGRSRLDALEVVGIEFEQKDGCFRFKYVVGGDLGVTECVPIRHVFEKGFTDSTGYHHPGVPDPYSYVDSVNLHRRHLTPEQKKERARRILKSSPEISDRTIAKQAGLSPSTVGKLREAVEDESGVQFGHLEVTGAAEAPSPTPTMPMAVVTPAASPEPKRRTGKDGKNYPVKSKGTKAKPKAATAPKVGAVKQSSAQTRNSAIEEFTKWFSGLTGAKLAEGLEDLVKLLWDRGSKIQAISMPRRASITLGILRVFNVRPSDLQPNP